MSQLRSMLCKSLPHNGTPVQPHRDAMGALLTSLFPLSAFLMTRHYHGDAYECILEHAATSGTLAGIAAGLESSTGYLDLADEEGAEDAYVSGLPPVPYDDPRWDADADAWELGPDTPDGSIIYPPEPSAQDLADYDAWLAQYEGYRPVEQPAPGPDPMEMPRDEYPVYLRQRWAEQTRKVQASWDEIPD